MTHPQVNFDFCHHMNGLLSGLSMGSEYNHIMSFALAEVAQRQIRELLSPSIFSITEEELPHVVEFIPRTMMFRLRYREVNNLVIADTCNFDVMNWRCIPISVIEINTVTGREQVIRWLKDKSTNKNIEPKLNSILELLQ